MAIASNKPSYFARDIMRALEFDHLFAEVLGPNDVERPKPDPEMLEIIIMRIGLSPEEVVYVGDMPLDVEVGRRAGVAVFAVPTGSATRDALLEARPDRLLPRFSDLLTFLPSLSGAREDRITARGDVVRADAVAVPVGIERVDVAASRPGEAHRHVAPRGDRLRTEAGHLLPELARRRRHPSARQGGEQRRRRRRGQKTE